MYHLIVTASTDGVGFHAHVVCREMQSDGKWHTVAVSGRQFPLFTGGLFGDPWQDLTEAITGALPALIAGFSNTQQ